MDWQDNKSKFLENVLPVTSDVYHNKIQKVTLGVSVIICGYFVALGPGQLNVTEETRISAM